jgi:hypothetical protein
MTLQNVIIMQQHWCKNQLFNEIIQLINRAHGGCDRSTGDAYSSMAPDPTSGVFRGPCKPDFHCGLFHYLNWTLILTTEFSVYLTSELILTADCSVYLIWTHWFWLLILRLIWGHGGCDRSAGDANSSMAPVPTSDIHVFRGLCTPILWFVFPMGLMRLITDRYFCHFII